MDGEELLKAHEAHSAARSAHLEKLIEKLEGIKMGTEGMTDSVTNVFKPAMAEGAGMLGGGLGAGVLGGLLGGLLFGRRGLDGDAGVSSLNNVNDAVFNTAVLTKLGTIEASVPLAESQVQLALQNQTNNLTTLAQTNANAQALANAGIKDNIQSLSLFLSNQINAVNQNVVNQGSETRVAVAASTSAILDKISQNTIDELRTQLARVESTSLARGTEVNVTQNVAQNQQQSQLQAQINSIVPILANLANDIQAVRQGQVIFNSGTMAGSGTQAAANTKVA